VEKKFGVVPAKAGDNYYPCVFLGRDGDGMQLLQFREGEGQEGQ
jgi:hypothetical protein